MRIVYKDIILRDYQETDIEDDIRWMTTETEWHNWDAPWEAEEALRKFNPETFYEKAMIKLKRPKTKADFRWAFEIDTKSGVHIGGVNSYFNDENYRWKPRNEGGCLYTLGIGICESAYWSKGYGTQAFAAFIKYHFTKGVTDVYTETWSGNYPMLALAGKLGFEECHRETGFRVAHGQPVDGIVFKLNNDRFWQYLNKD